MDLDNVWFQSAAALVVVAIAWWLCRSKDKDA